MNGYHYHYEYDQDIEVGKIFHWVTTPDGETKNIPWSPYEHMDDDDFKLWIHLGMPNTTKYGNFTKTKLIEYLNETIMK